jgi:spermidine synthase
VSARSLRLVLSTLFAVTGFSALCLQVVWQRVISMHSGVDLFSITTVVAAFLGGLGVGSLVGGGLADRLGPRRSLLAFSMANAGIAVFAFVSIFLFYDLYRSVVSLIGESLLAAFLFNFVLLIVPTILMGLSLPLVSRGLVAAVDEIGPLVGRLYAINTLGAAIGSAVAGWFLLGTFGFVTTVRIAGSLNLVASVLVFTMWRQTESASGRIPVTTATEDPPRSDGDERVWPWYAVYALTGAVALGLEIVFFRVIDTVMRSNSYTFAHVLSLYLLLFASGSAIGARLVRRTDRPERWFLWCQFGAGVTALGGMLLMLVPLKLPSFLGIRPFLEEYFASNGFVNGGWGFDMRTAFANVIAPLLIMGGPVLFLGAAFPFIQATVARKVESLGRRTGTLLFANIVGNVMGSLLVGFVLLHVLGTAGTLRLLATLLLIPGLAAAAMSVGPRRIALAVGAVAVIGFGVAVFPSNKVFWQFLHSGKPNEFVLDEERSCVTSIKKFGTIDLLHINGSNQNGYPWDDFHVLIGLVPAVLHPNPEKGLAVGLGMGGTTYGMALDPRIDEVRTVEICGGEMDLLRGIGERDKGVMLELFTDPRIKLEEGDGRKALLNAERDLDIITVDTLRPTSAFSGSLYSKEFYDLVESRLSDDGIFIQWIPEPRVLTTIREAFPHVTVFSGAAYNQSQFFVATRKPLEFDRDALLSRLAATPLRTVFHPEMAAQIEGFFAAIAPQPLPPQGDVREDRINRDLFPRDEYFLNQDK